jgi:hypothetical protein
MSTFAMAASRENFLFIIEGARHFLTIGAMGMVVYYLMF